MVGCGSTGWRCGCLRGLVDAELGEQRASAASTKRGRRAGRGLGDVDRRVERDAAVGRARDAVGEQDRLVDVVGDEQHRRPVARAQLRRAARASGCGSARRARRTARRAAAARARARAPGPSATRCASPPDSVLRPVALVRRASPTSRERGPPALARVGAAQAEHDVVEHARPRQQPGVLEHHRPPRGHDDRARRRRRRGRRARAAACSCRCRCARAARRTRPSRQLEVEAVEHLAVAERAPDAASARRRRRRRRQRVASVRSSRDGDQLLVRHCSALLSRSRTSASDSRPSTRVDREADDDDVGLEELLRVDHQVADAVGRVDLLGEHEDQPRRPRPPGAGRRGSPAARRAARPGGSWRTGRARPTCASSKCRGSIARIAGTC